MREITNTEDVIDSRDVIERIEELNDEYEDLKSEAEDDTNVEVIEARQNLKDWEELNLDELNALLALQDQAGGSPDWQYGEGLIRESYFTEYCEELCFDIGDIPKELPWYIANHIDWDGVAREIKMDYTEVDFDGVSYFIRS